MRVRPGRPSILFCPGDRCKREHEVPGARIIPRDLQRGDPRPPWSGHQEEAGAEGAPRARRVREGHLLTRRQ